MDDMLVCMERVLCSTVPVGTAVWSTAWRCSVNSSAIRSFCWVSFELLSSDRTSSYETESMWRLSSVSLCTLDSTISPS